MSAIGSILSNSGALAALNGIASAQNANNTYENQLSSGLSINSPADNPAGFITAQGFTSQVNGITQASSNANEGISLLQTAQGAVQQQLNVAQKLNSIAVQAANGTQTPQEAQSLQGVVTQLTSQITSIANQTQFNNINLLDGTFSGVQFQIGANEGQTLSLAIGGTQATNLGMNTLLASAGIYNSTNPSAAATKSTAGGADVGAFTPGPLKIVGSNGEVTIKTSSGVASATTSASTIATAVNKQTATTNVSAQAFTQATVLLVKGTSGGYNFTVGNGNGSAPSSAATVTGTTLASVVSSINNNTAKTGITASVATGSGNTGGGNIILTQSSGKNIAIKNGSSTGEGTITVSTGTTTSSAAAAATAGTAGGTLTIQGKVSFQSDAAFSVSGASSIGLSNSSHLLSLSNINVSTQTGANQAINVVKFTIEGLNNLGGQLGASQQRLQATLNNLTTTNTNLQNGLATVQDANIPQVSQDLTQSQIQAQAGVAALKSSSTLQQAYLSLLP